MVCSVVVDDSVSDDTEVVSGDDTEVVSGDDTEVVSGDDTEVVSGDDTTEHTAGDGHTDHKKRSTDYTMGDPIPKEVVADESLSLACYVSFSVFLFLLKHKLIFFIHTLSNFILSC